MIPILEPNLGKEEEKNVLAAVKSGWISSKGEFIHQFESSFAKYCKAKYAVSASNGTAALHLALKALGIKKGDEVLVPDLTFISTLNAVTYCGAKPVLVDVAKDSFCMDPAKIEQKITKDTKAIIVVHLYGYPCDMKAILKLAKRYKLKVVEDAAEALGAEYQGKKSGILGDIGCFSFYGNKIITTGEGGMCTTNDKALAQTMKVLRDHGMSTKKKYWHDVIGFNYRMTNIQAALGLAQLKKINQFIRQKRYVAAWYQKGLKDLVARGEVSFVQEQVGSKSVFWLVVILFEESFGSTPEKLAKRLLKKGIETRPVFYPMHALPPYENNHSFPVATLLNKKGLCLPSSTKLTKEQVMLICQEIKQAVKK